jgi:hypothetical protein
MDLNTPAADAVPETPSRLRATRHARVDASADFACAGLEDDAAVVLHGVGLQDADAVMLEVARRLGLDEQLEIQAGFAEFRGHRKRASRYFMTVNARGGYQFIPPHSEGTRSSAMRLAAFHCVENTTDGGASILMNVDSDGPAWARLREVAYRGIAADPSAVGRQARMQARAVYGLESVSSALAPDDEVLSAVDSAIPGIEILRVLSRPVPIRCPFADREVLPYWDSIASHDFDSGREYLGLLRAGGLLRNGEPALGIEQLDNAHERRLWSSGATFPELFRARVTVKLGPGDLVIQNNLTWTHSTSNWTPGSGVRTVLAAFA